MPANQYFDQKHLQDVVLAQSRQIEATARFSSPEIVTRPVLVLTAIVALVAIFLGVKNYVEQPQKARPPASSSTPVVVHSNVVSRAKSASAKTRRTRLSATKASAAADDTEKPLIGAYAGAKAKAATENGANALSAQAAADEAEANMPGYDRVGYEDRIGGPTFSECLPLPNGTQPGDVDAPYYFRWAGEYCGRDLLASPRKAPESQKSKK